MKVSAGIRIYIHVPCCEMEKPNRIYHTYEQLGFEVNVILQVADVISIAGCSCCSRQGRVPRKDGAARMSGMI